MACRSASEVKILAWWAIQSFSDEDNRSISRWTEKWAPIMTIWQYVRNKVPVRRDLLLPAISSLSWPGGGSHRLSKRSVARITCRLGAGERFVEIRFKLFCCRRSAATTSQDWWDGITTRKHTCCEPHGEDADFSPLCTRSCEFLNWLQTCWI